jgi:iron(III) transport system permease protein
MAASTPGLGAAPTRSATLGDRLRSVLQRIGSFPFVFRLLLSLVLAAIVVYPFLRLLDGSFRTGGALQRGDVTLQNYRDVFDSSTFPTLLKNTIIFTTGQTVLPLVIGTFLALVVNRTNMPFARAFGFMTVALLFTPLLAAATAWVILLGPRSGLLNTWIRAISPFDGVSAYSMTGMILIQSFYLVPIVFLLVGASFRSVNPELEEASRISGAGPWSTFRAITLGVSRPAIASAGAVCAIIGLGSLEIPLLFGAPAQIQLLTTEIYTALELRFPPAYGRSAATAISVLLLSIVVLVAYAWLVRHPERYITVGGKAARTVQLNLGRGRWLISFVCGSFLFVALILPLLAVTWGSFLPFIGRPSVELYTNVSLDNYRDVLDNSVFRRGVKNSAILSVTAGAAVMALGAGVAYVAVRMRSVWSRAIDTTATVPLALPNVVMASALLFAFVSISLPFDFKLWGTLWILGIAYVAFFIPLALRTMSGPMYQLSADLEHASRIAGARPAATFVRIVVPLLAPALASGFLLAVIIFSREFVNSVLLYGPGTEVISVVMSDYYSNGRIPQVAAISVLLSLGIILILFIATRVFRIKISSS